jgi:DtxR family Mn-dependent transcriptional regulator
MAETEAKSLLTGALEDYLETIYELVREHKLARVKDIAKARGVRSGSVSPAMKRLADLGLIRYVQREYIDLTPEGEKQARSIYAKHQLLTRFFEQFLKMSAKEAQANACAMEHSLSADGMDHLTRFFEYLQVCPEGSQFLERFHQCPLVRGETDQCGTHCSYSNGKGQGHPHRLPTRSLSELKPGERARVAQVNGSGAIRQRLLDMGLLPNVQIEVERVAPTGSPIWIKLGGFQLSLRPNEADAVMVEKK